MYTRAPSTTFNGGYLEDNNVHNNATDDNQQFDHFASFLKVKK